MQTQLLRMHGLNLAVLVLCMQIRDFRTRGWKRAAPLAQDIAWMQQEYGLAAGAAAGGWPWPGIQQVRAMPAGP